MNGRFDGLENEKRRRSVEDLTWLVFARYDAQSAVLLLHEFEDKYSPLLLQHKNIMSAFLTLNGAALSLWRAAFLMSDDVRSLDDARNDARQLRVRILEDNLVTFMVDRSTEKWMGGYYLKNAKYRLDEVSKGLRAYWIVHRNDARPSLKVSMMRKFSVISRRPFRERHRLGKRWQSIEDGLCRGDIVLCKEFEELGPRTMNQEQEQAKIWHILNTAMQDLLFCLFAIALSPPRLLLTPLVEKRVMERRQIVRDWVPDRRNYDRRAITAPPSK